MCNVQIEGSEMAMCSPSTPVTLKNDMKVLWLHLARVKDTEPFDMYPCERTPADLVRGVLRPCKAGFCERG